MIIETVKINGNGWLVNASIFVPNDPVNRHYQTVQNWIDAGNIPDPEFTAEELRKKEIAAAKIIRDDALNALIHDFGDGRIMQTRPKDESNIRNAIEIMTANSIPSIGWAMVDDIKQNVTVADLQTALQAGQLAALAIWDAYNP